MNEHGAARSWRERLRSQRGALAATWMLPVLAWVVGTLYLGGALGQSTDDYSINLRDPVTREMPSPFNPLQRYPFFWRPLHTAMCFTVGTYWPDREGGNLPDRAVHVFVALMHGLACIGLWAVMRRLTSSRIAPVAAALLFMVLPLHGEVAFWFCTTSTAIGTALFCGAALAAMRFAERGAVWLLGVVFVMMFGVACFYEQAAAPAAALPVLCLGAWWRMRGTGGTGSVRMGVVRAVVATGIAGLACVGYVGLLLRTAPEHARGGSGSIVTAERMVERLSDVTRGVRHNLVGDRAGQIVRGSVELGWEVLSTPRGLVVGTLVLAAGLLWMVWGTRLGGSRIAREGEATRSGGAWLVAAGFAAFFAAWLPVYVIDRQIVELRNTYVPLVGVAMVVAGLIDLLVCRMERLGARAGAAGRAVVATVVVTAAGAGVIGLVGNQAFFKRRAEQDRREVATLKACFPNPPPYTLFVPIRTAAKAARTGEAGFDRSRHGVFETPWSAHAAVTWAWGRADIGATSSFPWSAALPVVRPREDGVAWERGLSPEMMALFAQDEDGPERARRLPWGNIVPFVTTEDGRVQLVRQVDVERADHRDLEIRVPLVQKAMQEHAGPPIPTTTIRMTADRPEDRTDLIPLKFWVFKDGSAAEFTPTRAWNSARLEDAVWLAANSPRPSMSIVMPPLDRPEWLLMRVSLAEWDLDPSRNPWVWAQELVVTMANAPERELAVVRMDSTEARKTRRWRPLVVTLPARPAGDEQACTIVVSVRVVGEPVRTGRGKEPFVTGTRVTMPAVWVTHGYQQSIVEK